MVLVPDRGTRGTIPAAPQPAPSPTAGPTTTPDAAAPDPELTRRLAVALGIMAGDDYGVHPDTPPPDQFAHIFHPSQKEFGVGGDPLHEATMAIARQSNAITPPTNGSTIYSGSFAHDLLASLNLPVTYENVRALNAWMKAETGSQGKGTPAFNPLATTQNYGSNTRFNSVGVKNYADYHTGIMATANVLVNGKYQGILDALARGNDALAVGRAVAASPWGTGNGVLRVLGAA